MSAEIINLATGKANGPVFAFHEACPICERMVMPFIVAGNASNRFRCDGNASHSGSHEPYHWKSGDHNVELGTINFGYDIPMGISRTTTLSIPDGK